MPPALSKIYLPLLILAFMSCKKGGEAGNSAGYGPELHFALAENRLDYPVGLVRIDGEYHLFYQYGKAGSAGEADRWGHAVSDDLLNWSPLTVPAMPDGLYPLGAGCIVADTANSSKFGSDGIHPLVAMIHSGDGLSLIYSLDRGASWLRSDSLSIPGTSGLDYMPDPYICRYVEDNLWLMLLPSANSVGFYTSTDLKNWTHASDFSVNPGVEESRIERLGFFRLDEPEGEGCKWILALNVEFTAMNEWLPCFFAGDFDGQTFATEQTAPYRIDYGKDLYGCMFADLGGRSLMLGWMGNWQYSQQLAAKGWNGSLAMPREVFLEKTPYYYILASQPVSELESRRDKLATVMGLEIVQDVKSYGTVDISRSIAFPLAPSELNMQFGSGENSPLVAAEKFGIVMSNSDGESLAVGYDAYHQNFYIDRTKASTIAALSDIQIQKYPVLRSEAVDMRLIVDRSSVELFAMNGKVAISSLVFPSSAFDRITVFAENGKTVLERLEAFRLRPVKNQKHEQHNKR